MKKLLLFLFANILSASSIIWAQAPNYITTLKNSAILLNDPFNYGYYADFEYRIIKINIPLYLNSPRNTTVKYHWYETKTVFGDNVRASDKPIKIEEGTYVNGLLDMYKKDADNIYKFIWSSEKEILSIILYNGKGAEKQRYSKNYDLRWTDNKTVSIRRPNEHTHSVSIANVLLISAQRRDDSNAQISLTGLYIENGYLREKRVSKYRWKGNWSNANWDKKIVQVMPDGRPVSPDIYDFNDRARCECFEY